MRLIGLSVCRVGLALLALSGCAERRDSASGVTDTNTNWLKACESDASCGGLNCLCGVCTVACERTQECARFSGDAECAMPSRGQCSAAMVCALAQMNDTSESSTCAECDASVSGGSSSNSGATSRFETETTVGSSVDVSPDPVTDASTADITSDEQTLESTDVRKDASTDVHSSDTNLTATNADAGDNSTDATDECPQATEGMACRGEGIICGGPCTDACQFCNRLLCSGGVWQRQETFPAPCTSCGDELNCNTLDSYCHIDAGTTYSCQPYPTECVSDHSCTCLQAQLEGVCTTDGTGLRLATGQSEQCDCTLVYSGSDWCAPYADATPVLFECMPPTAVINTLNEECTPLPTDEPRWCCPTTFALTCE